MNCVDLLDAGVCQRPAVSWYEHSWLVHPLPNRPYPETGFPGDTALHRGSPQTRAREPETGNVCCHCAINNKVLLRKTYRIIIILRIFLGDIYIGFTISRMQMSPKFSCELCVKRHCTTNSHIGLCVATQERLVLSILPRFVALEMIADISAMEDEVNPQEFHKIYIHQYKDVRYTHAHMYLFN